MPDPKNSEEPSRNWVMEWLGSLLPPALSGSSHGSSEKIDLFSKQWPSPDSEAQILPGNFSRVIVNVSGPRKDAKLSGLAIEATSERGEPILRFELEGAPSERLQRALLNLIAPAYASKDVDTYLNDIRILVQTDLNLSWKQTLPAPYPLTDPVKPLRHHPLSFPEFMADPGRARNVFFCRAVSGDSSGTLIGEVSTQRRLARLRLVERDADGTLKEYSDYILPANRKDSRGLAELHQHLKAQVWDAMELFWKGGKEGFQEKHGSGKHTPISTDASLSGPPSEVTLEERLRRGQNTVVNPTFSRVTPGGTSLSLEIGRTRALLNISLRLTPGDETFYGVIYAQDTLGGFSEQKISELKCLAQAMCRADRETRETACGLMLGKLSKRGLGMPLHIPLTLTIDSFRQNAKIIPDPYLYPFIGELLLRGYQPALLQCREPPLLSELPMMFPSMLVGYKADGSVSAELVGGFNQRVLFEAPAPAQGGVKFGNQLLRSLCEVFTQQPSTSWLDVMSFLSAQSSSIPGASLNLKSYEDGTSLPPLNDQRSLAAYQRAADLMAFLQTGNLDINPFSTISHVGPGKAEMAIRVFTSEAWVCFAIQDDAVTEVVVYPSNPAASEGGQLEPLIRQPCRIRGLESQETRNLLLRLIGAHYETFTEPDRALRKNKETQRARFEDGPLLTALASLPT